jgi:uncharacterized protein YneF (UPF0154 family)
MAIFIWVVTSVLLGVLLGCYLRRQRQRYEYAQYLKACEDAARELYFFGPDRSQEEIRRARLHLDMVIQGRPRG